ncbi:galactose-1-phosphate uridylyltransferase [Agrilactobacillus composti DSM 18527 = JCM 14202]|uniref:Galactose-1-phosphate uridylyltransferase n=2 Tax=Agrilactobacillus TaxID=2767875 RepID=A0A0R1XU14_9LACO|nr:UDP-glucose--hexose-1-phosphate uridylyltransferase [Agrilactobacillus composti]KRM33409.1 galactose-1-phosphate uridylyltransferase [Agrilactobacillus composti DSM 18527 = JCM 14202]
MTERNLAELFADQIIALKTTFAPMDRIYLINQIYRLVGEKNLTVTPDLQTPIDVAQALVQSAIQNDKITDSTSGQEILEAELTDFYTPRPAQVNHEFWNDYQISPERATAYFYDISRRNDYIKTAAIAKNISYDVPTEYGDLEITINLSKPEKDPKEIAKAKNMPKTNYPMDQLSMANEGYQGRSNFPARTNHRIIRLTLGGETWGFQYSPYAYFGEHCIFLSDIQRPMHIDTATFSNLFEIVRLLPHYFVGSNADLPIVGGSMLSHDHYQGGRHDFPMAKAPVKYPFTLPGFEDLQAGIVAWPMSVIRLAGKDVQRLIAASGHVLDVWRHYTDDSVSVRAEVDGQQHHTITPIVRKRADNFEIDLVLRDNQTSAQYPDGIFHPHQDVQHIKKENIGLIEVMGRAILPARLKSELHEVEKYVLNQANDMKAYHKAWADDLKQRHEFTADNVTAIVEQETGLVFKRVLEDAGVFKTDEAGQAAFKKFVEAL